MKKNLFLLTILLVFSYTTEMYAWGKQGHRVIAEIAEQNLNRRAHRRVIELLDNYPMAYWSDWSDAIRSDTTDQFTRTLIWHYINIPSNLSRVDFQNSVYNFHQENVYFAVNYLQEVLRDRNTSEREKAIALRHLIHFVGDLHNPMHTAREEDLGGNRIIVTWFGNERNLHSIWDSGVVDDNYSYTEYANILNGVLTKDCRRAIQQGKPIDWLWETYQITNQIYAGVNAGDRLSFSYTYKWTPTVEQQFQRAGIRLANILNNIF
jgi:hypothetical protein